MIAVSLMLQNSISTACITFYFGLLDKKLRMLYIVDFCEHTVLILGLTKENLSLWDATCSSFFYLLVLTESSREW